MASDTVFTIPPVACPHHMGPRGPDDEKRSEEMDFEHSAELVDREAVERAGR